MSVDGSVERVERVGRAFSELKELGEFFQS